MSGVWVFKNGVVRLVENPSSESLDGRRKVLVHKSSNEVITSYAVLERKLTALGWERITLPDQSTPNSPGEGNVVLAELQATVNSETERRAALEQQLTGVQDALKVLPGQQIITQKNKGVLPVTSRVYVSTE
ncbi:hypothetical protein GIB67_006849 [Kingdonia uniflora]|uniref:Uncharacterized protein n=1 Tax=Kingdonia uniflora TaxID=39325 RepID=A0A7J7L036_9MAGN|nr:hypothetical protein GIB67_006849 [Kingdonia uniflora]